MQTWRREPINDTELRRELAYPVGPVRKLVAVAELASTNTALVEAALTEPLLWPERTVLLADHQTAGRGRQGRSWQTPAGTSLTLSLLLRPAGEQHQLPVVTLGLALAACRAITQLTGISAQVKWPNDVVVDLGEQSVSLAGWGTLRKVGGILAQSLGDGRVVIGIGLNLSQEQAELPVPHASSLHLAGARPVTREALATCLVREFFDLLAQGLDEVLQLATPQVVTLGKQVQVTLPGEQQVQGLALGLSPTGALVVQGADGQCTEVLAGEVTHLRFATN